MCLSEPLREPLLWIDKDFISIEGYGRTKNNVHAYTDHKQWCALCCHTYYVHKEERDRDRDMDMDMYRRVYTCIWCIYLVRGQNSWTLLESSMPVEGVEMDVFLLVFLGVLGMGILMEEMADKVVRSSWSLSPGKPLIMGLTDKYLQKTDKMVHLTCVLEKRERTYLLRFLSEPLCLC